jgi:hypothetical protein
MGVVMERWCPTQQMLSVFLRKLTMLGNLFRKKNDFDDAMKLEFATTIATGLKIQTFMAGKGSIEDEQGRPKPKVLGYVYGFTDAVLRVKGRDMTDMSVGPPVTYHVLRQLWPEHANKYMEFIFENLTTNSLMHVGIMHGGQQFLDFVNGKLKAPMGLALFLLEQSKDHENA